MVFKLFGYLDDVIVKWYNWQIGLPLQWGIPLALLEIIFFVFVIERLRYLTRGY